MIVTAELTCCVDDVADWCPVCDRIVSVPFMMWVDVDLYICYECADVPRPRHVNWEYETVRR